MSLQRRRRESTALLLSLQALQKKYKPPLSGKTKLDDGGLTLQQELLSTSSTFLTLRVKKVLLNAVLIVYNKTINSYRKIVNIVKTITLIAHDKKKDTMLEFVVKHIDVLRSHHLIATATTGKRIRDNTDLAVDTVLSGPLGGDMQIGAKIAAGEVDLVVFLRDPLTAQPHEPDITALLRVCDVHDVPVVTNLAGAEIVLAGLK